jgi:hypothetical protein
MGRLSGLEGVFALGNAVTGRGNIRASRMHSRAVANWVAEKYLGQGENQSFRKDGRSLSSKQFQEIIEKTARLQEKAGYNGNYQNWIKRHLPKRLENLV